MPITKSNLYSQSWKTIRDFLKNNVTDPVTKSKSSTRKWIYNRLPLAGSNFKGLPFIHVSNITIPDEQKAFGKTSPTYLHKCQAIISVFSSEDKNTGESPQLDILSDEINQNIKEQTSMTNDGIMNINVADVGVDDTNFNNAPVRVRTFTMEADLAVGYGTV